MHHRFSCTLPTIVIAVLAATATPAERSRNPTEATVFIRVIGTARVIVEGAFSETREEKDVEFGTGSGFIFTPYGHVLTNYHVIESTTIQQRIGRRDVEVELVVDRVQVVLPASPNARFDASIEVVDPELDLAVLSIAGGELPYLALGDSEAVAQGDAVQVYGFPFGRQVEVGKANLPDIVPRVSASRGSVAATRTDASGGTAYLQTTATVNPGNSGGPMLDEDGYVLGVVRLKLRDSDGIGFAIPVNAVKDFLTSNGYDQLLPVETLRLGLEQSLEGKGLALRMPETLLDVSPARLRVFTDRSQGAIGFTVDRVVTPWSLPQLEQVLLAGGTFGSFQAVSQLRSSAVADGRGVAGRASGRDASSGIETSMEYLLLEAGGEKLIARYQGPADAVAFNRSVLIQSLRSVRAETLLTAAVARALLEEQLVWVERALPEPSAPTLVIPARWDEEVSAPFACRGLPPWESALSMSPPGDFTVSLRAGWWSSTMNALQSARACSDRSGALGEGSYAYTLDWLGERYVVEGIFVENAGTMQLELVAPEGKHGFVRDAARAWMEQNR
ncbi:MAG: hypothetical protein BMS9Abin37_1843 [Acidobacteriota bacterium]|nr:MAG: hypothetical protein BMS9Abin37_1843 [Acidobacteriota bacterium]